MSPFGRIARIFSVHRFPDGNHGVFQSRTLEKMRPVGWKQVSNMLARQLMLVQNLEAKEKAGIYSLFNLRTLGPRNHFWRDSQSNISIRSGNSIAPWNFLPGPPKKEKNKRFPIPHYFRCEVAKPQEGRTNNFIAKANKSYRHNLDLLLPTPPQHVKTSLAANKDL